MRRALLILAAALACSTPAAADPETRNWTVRGFMTDPSVCFARVDSLEELECPRASFDLPRPGVEQKFRVGVEDINGRVWWVRASDALLGRDTKLSTPLGAPTQMNATQN